MEEAAVAVQAREGGLGGIERCVECCKIDPCRGMLRYSLFVGGIASISKRCGSHMTRQHGESCQLGRRCRY